MRNKVAKSLRRAAMQHAGHKSDTYHTIARKIVRKTPHGDVQYVAYQDILVDGPRIYYLRLKKAFRAGLFSRR